MSHLETLIIHCQRYIPTITAQFLLNVSNSKEIQTILDRGFPPLSTTFDAGFYGTYIGRMKTLLDFGAPLKVLPNIEMNNLNSGIHSDRPSHSAIDAVLQHLHIMQGFIFDLHNHTEATLCETLDKHPRRTEAELASMMTKVWCINDFTLRASYSSQISLDQSLIEGKIPNISFRSFKTLGAREWLNDEVINYFLNKWCSRSCTLGLSTFFACKILFDDEDNSCVHAKRGVLTAEDAKRALKWCRRAEVCGPESFVETVTLDYSRRAWLLIWIGTQCSSQSMNATHTGIRLISIFATRGSMFMIAHLIHASSTARSLFFNGRIQTWCL